MHHIISDGVSQAVLEEEFARLCSDDADARGLEPLRLQYKDFACRLNGEAQQQHIALQGDYWLERFSGELPVLELPTDAPRPAVRSYEGGALDFRLSAEETRALKQLAESNHATLYMTLSACFTLLLSKLSGAEDIILGGPTAGRRHAELASIIGMFVNTLAFRNAVPGGQTFSAFLAGVKENA
ncbi:condensation domain-containing protein, partial [Herbaspirillum sp.]|uniref:condensation domain-containing protein n=1 Tax=Herbaspirillum sp. TaxID=1890675 RepID=UPI00258AECB7